MIESVLVANRGEIARRVFRTCADLGIGTVAVYSDADAALRHASEADAGVRLPGNTPSETYLRSDLLIRAAKDAGADAVHPGYGFLSERADFAQAVLDAGLTWIGPPVTAIEQMGSKVESKRMMADAGVPVLSELDPSQVTEDMLPVLVKASAGGGGRGMRIVNELSELSDSIASAEAEAGSAFGDSTVFCERYLTAGRHIEVQVMADQHGTVWAVGERECSIQRRHQKVVEEAPSPLVTAVSCGTPAPGRAEQAGQGSPVRPSKAMRERLFEAARNAAKAIGYVGAGTVEFLALDNGEFFFLEMNTRLQVEHPVTELTTGLDLVALQIRVAEGEKLPPEPPAATGHAIEVRLYAEDPSKDWQPQSGTLRALEIPRVAGEFALIEQGIRLDSGFVSGDAVGVHYDPMLAKVISFAPTRTEAARALAKALDEAKIHGVVTNRDLLVNVLRHDAFLAGDTDTAFFDKHGLDTLAASRADERAVRLSALAAALADMETNRSKARVNRNLPAGWRNIVSQPTRKTYVHGDDEIPVAYRVVRGALQAGISPATPTPSASGGFDGVELEESTPDSVVLRVDGVRRKFDVAAYGADVYVDSALGSVALQRKPRYTDPDAAVQPGSLLAPMPGSVLRLAVDQGDTVKEGDPVLWLEAMKMEHKISSPADGVVAELNVTVGQQVDVGAVLAVVQDAEELA